MNASVKTWVGRQLGGGRYRVAAKLGEGGMGCVFKAHDANLDCDVVVKVPRPSMLDDPEFAGRFAREIHSLVRLVHPHIVRITDVGQEDGVPFAVMQYLPGGSLHDRQHRPGDRLATLPPAALAGWLEPVAEALDYIHQQGYVHRDIKPANILFDGQGNAYVSDFGVAKAVGGRTLSRSQSLTGTGMVLGTPEYMAPEMLLGEDYGGGVDQYALAVTVYELLSGRVPFQGHTPGAILLQQTSGQAAALHRLVPAVPRDLSAAVARALAREPKERFATCLAFAQAALHGLSAAAENRGASGRMAAGPVPERAAEEQQVICPKCGRAYKVPARAAHKRLRCAKCQEVIAPSGRAPTPGPRASAETDRQRQARIDTKGVPVLRGTREAAPAPPPEVADRPETPPAGGGGWKWAVGGMAVVLAVGAAGGALWWRSSAPSPVPSAPAPRAEGSPAPRAATPPAPAPYAEASRDPRPEAAPAEAPRVETPKPPPAHAAPAFPVTTEQTLLDRGQAHFRRREYDEARVSYNEALRLNPQSALAHAGLGEVCLARHEYDQGVQECTAAIDLDRKLAVAYVHRAAAHAARGDQDRALADYGEALRLNPDKRTYTARGNAYLDRDTPDLALDDFDRAITLDETYQPAYRGRAEAYYRKRLYDRALADDTAAIRLNEGDAAAYNHRGQVYFDKGAYDKAIENYDRAVKLEPNFARAFCNRGNAYLARRDADRALASYNKALDLQPDMADALRGRTRAYRLNYEVKPAGGPPPKASDGDASRGESKDDPSNQLVQEKQYQVVNYPGLKADPKTTLQEVLDELTSRYGLTVDVNERAFRAEGVQDVLSRPAAAKAIRAMSDVTLGLVVQKVLANVSCPVAIAHEFQKDRLVITTERALRARRRLP
jgi:tetratricopeptide (TPR) repeat protein